jgi:short-subunit dehydrogenase
MERIVRVNLLGEMYGTKAALQRMKPRGGGTIINIGSALSWRAIPLQSIYCATKHGIKGFTDAVRLELEHENAGITITLIGPSSINTPFFSSARSKLGVKPRPVPPVYEPRVVAQAILHAAEHPTRDIVVGGWGKFLTVMERLSPRMLDRYMLFRGQMFRKQRTNEPDDGKDALFGPIPQPGRTSGDFGQRSKSTSIYTTLVEEHPSRRRSALVAFLAALAVLVRRLGR